MQPEVQGHRKAMHSTWNTVFEASSKKKKKIIIFSVIVNRIFKFFKGYLRNLKATSNLRTSSISRMFVP